MNTRITNWAGNYEYSTTNIHYPKTTEEIQAIVRKQKKLRVLGTRHSFNGIADSTDTIISLENLARSVQIDHKNNKVLLSANMRYGDLSQQLHASGYALHNLGSLPHISVAGACATATHGSGDRNRNLATAVSAVEIVDANGDLISFSRENNGEMFKGVVVSLGGLGVIVNLTLDLLPAFEISQRVYEKLPIVQLEAHFDEIMASAYSVSLFTDWQSEFINQVWLKKKPKTESLMEEAAFFGAIPAGHQMHPIAEFSASSCTQQLGVAGAWHERLPHFRFDATPSAGNELQSEYFVPRRYAVDALRAVHSLRHEFAPYLFISEIRSVAADTLWLSPCRNQDSIAFHFTWKLDWAAVSQLLPLLEAKLAPFDARPHWGKLFTMSPQRLQSLYEKLPQFQQLLLQHDPQGKFRNEFLETCFSW